VAATRDLPKPSGFQLATLGRRFGALLVDWLISVLACTPFVDPRGSGWPPVAALILINTVGIGLFARTPGMAITGLRCISFTHGGPIGAPRALLRGFLLALLIPAAVMDDLRRGLHDKAADSIVVVAPRGPAT
jgi:uncharacterized RDD family membrane protein YckC